jgi:hypothetical protein
LTDFFFPKSIYLVGGGSSSDLESLGETWRQTMGAICSRRASEDRGLSDAKGMRELQQQQHNSSPVQQPAPCPSPSRTNGTITAAAVADTTVAPKVFVMVATHGIEDLEERKKTPELADAKPESGAAPKTEFSYVNEDFSFEAATAAAAASAGASSVDDDDANGGHGTTVNNNNTNTEEQQRVRLSRMLSARASAVRSKTTNAAKKGAFRVHTSSIIIFLPMGLDHCKKLRKMLFCYCRGMGGA